MLQKSTLDFLKKLKLNNNKDWFEANRKQYESAKADILRLTERCLTCMSGIEPAFQELEPKQCIFRIHRDVRFSKDKSPYKTNMGIILSPGGKKSSYAGLYIHIEPGNSFVGGGIWAPDADSLKKIRQEVDYNYREFKDIVASKQFRKYYGDLSVEDALKKPPKGYQADNPALHYLRLRHYVVSRALSDAELLNQELMKELLRAFEIIRPFLKFLDTALGEQNPNEQQYHHNQHKKGA